MAKPKKLKVGDKVVIGKGYLVGNAEFRFYCGLPVWDHHALSVTTPEELRGVRVMLVAEVLPDKRPIRVRGKEQ